MTVFRYITDLIFLLFVLLTICHDPQKAWANSDMTKTGFSVGLGADYAKGDFGSGNTEDYVSTSLIIDAYMGRFDMELTIPVILQNGDGAFYANSGEGYRYRYASSRSVEDKMKGSGSGSGSNVFSGGDISQPSSGAPAKGMSNESSNGLGDISLSARYAVFYESDYLPGIRFEVFTRFPTGDSEEGLGGGSFDWGPGFTLEKNFGNWLVLFQERYIFCGSSDYSEKNDHFTHQADIGYAFSEAFYGGISLYTSQKESDSYDDPIEGKLIVRWRFGEDSHLETYYLKGFSDGSPDFGVGTAFFIGF